MFVDWESDWYWLAIGAMGFAWVVVTALLIVIAAWRHSHRHMRIRRRAA